MELILSRGQISDLQLSNVSTDMRCLQLSAAICGASQPVVFVDPSVASLTTSTSLSPFSSLCLPPLLSLCPGADITVPEEACDGNKP